MCVCMCVYLWVSVCRGQCINGEKCVPIMQRSPRAVTKNNNRKIIKMMQPSPLAVYMRAFVSSVRECTYARRPQSASLQIRIYTYVYMYTCIYVHTHTHTHTHTHSIKFENHKTRAQAGAPLSPFLPHPSPLFLLPPPPRPHHHHHPMFF